MAKGFERMLLRRFGEKKREKRSVRAEEGESALVIFEKTDFFC